VFTKNALKDDKIQVDIKIIAEEDYWVFEIDDFRLFKIEGDDQDIGDIVSGLDNQYNTLITNNIQDNFSTANKEYITSLIQRYQNDPKVELYIDPAERQLGNDFQWKARVSNKKLTL
jgi:hypothetical protein